MLEGPPIPQTPAYPEPPLRVTAMKLPKLKKNWVQVTDHAHQNSKAVVLDKIVSPT